MFVHVYTCPYSNIKRSKSGQAYTDISKDITQKNENTKGQNMTKRGVTFYVTALLPQHRHHSEHSGVAYVY